MASIDEAYLDMTGTERLHGPPLAAAHMLHDAVQREPRISTARSASAASRMVAKIASDQAKPNGMLWIVPGNEARFLAPLDVRKIPGVGKVTEQHLHACGIRKIGDLAALDEHSSKTLRAMGPGAGGKGSRRGRGRMVRRRYRRRTTIRNPSAMSILLWWIPPTRPLDAMLVRLSEMVARRLRDHPLLRAHGADQAALFRFLHVHPRAHAGSCDADRHRIGRRGARPVSESLDAQAHPAAGRVCATARSRRGPDRAARRDKTEALAQDASRRWTKFAGNMATLRSHWRRA